MSGKKNSEFTRQMGKVVTAEDLAGLDSGSVLRLPRNSRLTPLASDLAEQRGITVVMGSEGCVAIGCDHGGFSMKGQAIEILRSLGREVLDLGTHSTEAVDYPDLAFAVGRAVADGHAGIGIVIDGAGIGSAIAANKVPGVRAAACYSVALARNSREHNGANVLSLGSNAMDPELLRPIIEAFLNTELTESRHARRVAKIVEIEKRYTR